MKPSTKKPPPTTRSTTSKLSAPATSPPGPSVPAKLSIELVPSTCWFSNLRSHLAPGDWDLVRKAAYMKARHRCEACGGVGPKWPVECHEIWSYDDREKIQRLDGVTALCPPCHQVKHIGLASVHGRLAETSAHLARVNGWTRAETERYVRQSFSVWQERSLHSWRLDLSWLNPLGITVSTERGDS